MIGCWILYYLKVYYCWMSRMSTPLVRPVSFLSFFVRFSYTFSIRPSNFLRKTNISGRKSSNSLGFSIYFSIGVFGFLIDLGDTLVVNCCWMLLFLKHNCCWMSGCAHPRFRLGGLLLFLWNCSHSRLNGWPGKTDPVVVDFVVVKFVVTCCNDFRHFSFSFSIVCCKLL